jgi:hypothetical protein
MHFAASAALTQDSTITLTNGADGRRGRIHVVQDSTGSWRCDFVVAGRTILLNLGENQTTPQAGVGTHTCYDYAFETIAGVACVVIERRRLTLILPALLDGLTVAPLLAVSAYRKLNSGYSGSAFRVRRSSDSTQTDIGFLSNGLVDTAALLTFCAGTNGFITIWYDQSGNGRDFNQGSTGAQPQIVSGGSLLTLGTSKPAIVFDGVDDVLGRTGASGAAGSGGLTCGFVVNAATTANRVLWSVGGNTVAGSRISLQVLSSSSVANEHLASSTTFNVPTNVNNDNYYVSGYPPGGTVANGYMRQNGSALALAGSTGTAAVNILDTTTAIGNLVAGAFFSNIRTNCFVLFGSVLAGANLTALESELNTHRS